MRRGEYWLSRVGISLLLFGVAFLFKYSIDQGWITPWLRTAFGFVVGAILIGFGYRTYAKRRTFANILLGGGLATWYITGFAAYQILELVTYPVALGFMVAVTVIAFLLAVRQNEAILSILAALGGFGTPFMLYSSAGNLPGLVAYTSLIIAGATGIYFFKGWKSLLWLSSICGWAVFAIGLAYDSGAASTLTSGDRFAVQAGIEFAWLCFWAVPILREWTWLHSPDRWVLSSIGFADKQLSDKSRELLGRHLHTETISAAIIGFGLTRLVWPDFATTTWGWLALGSAVVYFAVAYGLRRMEQFRALAYTHLLVALAFLTMGLTILLHGEILLVTVATEAAILHLVARRLSDRVVAVAAHVLHGLIAYWMVYQVGGMLFGPTELGFFRSEYLADVWVVITMAIGAAVTRDAIARRMYSLFAAAALMVVMVYTIDTDVLLFWLAGELAALFAVGWIIDDRFIMGGAHLLFAVTIPIFGGHLIENREDRLPILSLWSLSELWMIGLASLVAVLTESRIVRRLYTLALIAAGAGWLVAELGNDLQMIALTLEALIVMLAAKTGRDRVIATYAHLFFALLFCYLGFRMVDAFHTVGVTPLLNWNAFTDVIVIGLIAAAGRATLSAQERLVYRLAAHAGVLGLLYSELLRLPNGQGWVSVAWGVYGIILLVIGLQANVARLRVVALATLGLLVGKLFLVDLDKLETIWRVLLFIGVGAAFMALSYYFRALWRSGDAGQHRSDSAPP